MEDMNDRKCIVSREARPAEDLIRFVAGPDGMVVPDLKRNLPGRGCWVTADRAHVDKAAEKNLFARALKTSVRPPDNLGALVDELLSKAALGSLGLARKAGAVALGAAKVEASVRSGKAYGVLHAREGSHDGVRKITAARRAVVHMGGPAIPAYKLFSEEEMSLALGATNVIHAAVFGRDAGKAALKRVNALGTFRGESADKPAAVALGTAEDVE
ncbi:YlxR domain-containing protein [Nitratireductor aquimarinus]|nr:RNA-binding protein [Tritonibacter mobilis]